ncbi:hypothetical protein [Virgibacillus alimentarius]|uniref:Cytoskeletal protein RodZ n=1 Tax=Virgibacillus alimentarius TaxID=698769 RepID=A0ABS4S7V0_9BACI|nr:MULTISPECIES: hypothetical protein [Virgibacillus]MBP2256969.1 cytoskeletal protein RodZ [Virgibacillus alimentarius]HLR68041.1 hypothetical protein [Virgibacillus sp.]
MMSLGLIIVIILLFMIATVWTLYIFKQEENKLKKYEKEGDTIENEMKRSLDYEKSSLKSNVPLQIWIYSITIVLSLAAFGIYLYFY